MPKPARGPFARPPALNTRSASSSEPPGDDSHPTVSQSEPLSLEKTLSTSTTATMSMLPRKIQTDSSAVRQVPGM